MSFISRPDKWYPILRCAYICIPIKLITPYLYCKNLLKACCLTQGQALRKVFAEKVKNVTIFPSQIEGSDVVLSLSKGNVLGIPTKE